MQAPDSVPVHKMFHCLCLNDFDFPNCLLLAQGPFRGKKGPPLGLRAGSSAPSSGATVPLAQLDDCAAARAAFAFFTSLIPPSAPVSVPDASQICP